MKRILALVTVLVMLFSVTAMAEPATGTAKGFGGDVTVTLTLTDGVITDVKAEGADETPGVGTPALEQLPAAMMAGNTVNVDVVSGATYTSNAVIEAAKLALTAAGVNPDDYMTKAEAAVAEDVTIDTDVVVVGAGGAGMSAALVANEKGAKVVVVESQAAVGGNTSRATGGMNAADTSAEDGLTFGENATVESTLKKAEGFADNAAITELAKTVSEQYEAYKAAPEGYFDTAELMMLDALIGGGGINDPELVKVMAEESSEAVEWLATYDIDLTNLTALGGSSVKRAHRPVDAEGSVLSVGAYMVPLMETAVKADADITLLTETKATEIIMKDGKAVGIIATGKTGNKITINAKAVVLASGGFGANLEMVAQYDPALEGFMTTNAPGLQGDGIVMAQAVGAATVDMDQIQIHPTVQADTSALITESLRGDGAILVNAEGKRFINEMETRAVVSAAEIAQTGSYSWLVVDDAMFQKSKVIQGYMKKGFLFSGNTYEELATTIGIDPAAFAETMAAWNDCVANKSDAEFGREMFANPLNTAPYYAVKVTAGIHHTMGGLKINENTQVISTNDTVIDGLYAAGEITGGVHGNNRLGGNAVADIVVFGRIAGEEAAAYALK